MNKIRYIIIIFILLSLSNPINPFPCMYIAPPGSVNLIFTKGIKTWNSLVKWEELKEAKLPIDEDTKVKCLQELSYLNWALMKEEDLSLLKAFVGEAQKNFRKFLTDQTIKNALLDPKGVLELVRRSHPYTLEVLHNPDLFTHHFRRHEGMYYRLFALKLLGRKPQGPVVVLNVDPHRDYMGGSESGDEYIRKDGYGIHVVHGITDLNWGAAIVRDGLADAVINAYGFPEKPLLKWFFITVYKNKSGDVVSDVPAYLIPNEFHSLVDNVQRDFPACQLHWTVDLDSFGPHPKDGLRQHIFFQPEAIPAQLTYLLKSLEGLQPHIVSLTTADSRDYLAPEASEGWITSSRLSVKSTFENVLFENGQSHLFGRGRPARGSEVYVKVEDSKLEALKRVYMMRRYWTHTVFGSLNINTPTIALVGLLENATAGLHGEDVKNDVRFSQLFKDFSAIDSLYNQLHAEWESLKDANPRELEHLKDFFQQMSAFLKKHDRLLIELATALKQSDKIDDKEYRTKLDDIRIAKESYVERNKFINKMFVLDNRVNLKELFQKLFVAENIWLIKECLQFQWEADDNLFIQGSSHLLSIVLEILAANAYEAYLEAKKKGKIEINAFKDKNDAVIQVRDEAGGINADIIDKIFKLGFSTKDKEHGLGLALAKTIVEDHGGTIEVQSKPGKGTTFTIRLPIEQTEDKLTLTNNAQSLQSKGGFTSPSRILNCVPITHITQIEVGADRETARSL